MLKKDKPKLYFKHKDILDQTQIESPNLALYMHENMLDFYSEIEDVANCVEVYSLTDYLESSVPFSFDVSLSTILMFLVVTLADI